MRSLARRLAFAIIGLFGAFLAASLAFAAVTGDDRAAATSSIRALESIAAHKHVAAEALQNARRALDRADDARAAADTLHAALLEGLAREWAETGRDLMRVTDAERQANETHRKAADAETKTLRARALIEETVARRGRAKAMLEELETTDSEKDAGARTKAPGTAPSAGSQRGDKK